MITLAAGVLATALAAAQASGGSAAAVEVDRRLTQSDLDDAVTALTRMQEEARLAEAEVDRLEKRRGEARSVLADGYERAVRDLEAEDQRERSVAITQFERYLADHPDDPVFAPDAMFRLAEFYYEAANDEYAASRERWRADAQREEGAGREAPPEPQKDYARSVGLYEQLLSRFPSYRFTHGIYYLLAYCLDEMGRGPEAQAFYAELVARFPASPFVPEAWVRIGDWHFDNDRLDKAAEAFAHMSAHPEHSLYARAIYKLGWTYYRMDDFPRAVEAFREVLDYYVSAAARTGKAPDGDMWPESIQYVATSFAAPQWGGFEPAKAWFAAAGGRSYEREVYARLGDAFFDETRYGEAVAAYKLVIAKAPLAAQNPRIHARIIQAWARDLRPEEELREREAYLDLWDDSTEWWRKNQTNEDLVAEVHDEMGKSLARVGTYYHALARSQHAGGHDADAAASYRHAARGYAEHVRRFPRSRSAYEFSYALADCLYGAGDLARAGQLFAQVRDDQSDTRFRADAALASVIAWEGEVTRLQQAGHLAAPKVLLAKDRALGAAVRATPLADAEVALVRESDALVAKLPAHPKATIAAYKAGELFYAHDDFPEARRRLEEVVARWPRAEVATYAANLIVESLLSARDWAAVAEAAGRLQQSEAARGSPALASSLQQFKLGGLFNRATQLMEQKQYESAGAAFVALVTEAPKHAFAHKALWNAAVCFEQARRFESALALYERIAVEYPGSSYAEESLFHIAWTAENAYDFDKAVTSYLRLVDAYPGSPHRKDALYNAARSLENLQRYEEAAHQFGRYADLYPNAEDAARTQFHAALIYEKSRDWHREIDALTAFERRFAGGQEPDLIVQSYLKLALAWRALGDEAKAREGYEGAVAAFGRRGLKPEVHLGGAAAAAEARFRLLEYDFARYDRIALPATANTKKLKKALEAKLAEMKRVSPLYNEVKKYRRPDWILAAFYRQAFLLERLAQTLYEAPIPPEFRQAGQEDYLAAYQDQLAQFAQPYEERAVGIYIQAMQAARDLHVKNEWTKRISYSLARYRPKEYPVLKEARGKLASADLLPLAWAEALDGAPPLLVEPVVPAPAPTDAKAAPGAGAPPGAPTLTAPPDRRPLVGSSGEMRSSS